MSKPPQHIKELFELSVEYIKYQCPTCGKSVDVELREIDLVMLPNCVHMDRVIMRYQDVIDRTDIDLTE